MSVWNMGLSLFQVWCCAAVSGTKYCVTKAVEQFKPDIKPHRAQYVAKNIVKSACLMLMAPFACIGLYEVMKYDSWSNVLFKSCGAMYSANDIVALVTMRLPLSTRLHHSCVAIMSMLSLWYIDYAHPSLVRGFGVLGAFSAITAPVNLYLGVRILGSFPHLKKTSLVIYGASTVLSAGWQSQHIMSMALHTHPLMVVAYTSLIAIVYYDDMILLSFLYKE